MTALESMNRGFQAGYNNKELKKEDKKDTNYTNGWLYGQRYRDSLENLVPAITTDQRGNLIVYFPYFLHGVELK